LLLHLIVPRKLHISGPEDLIHLSTLGQSLGRLPNWIPVEGEEGLIHKRGKESLVNKKGGYLFRENRHIYMS
jgi:hypothetical protein